MAALNEANEHAVYAATAPDATSQTFHVGTRRSLLARVQADAVVKDLQKAWPQHHFEVHAMSTTGDNNQKTALHKFNEKALWTQELEVLLQKGDLDVIVHCLKDMPTQLPTDLEIGCITPREDPRDAFVVKQSLVDKYKSLGELPEGAVVGTSSLRRSAQMQRKYPNLRFASVRGNIGSRLGKLDDPESEYSAIVIAVAGLARLGQTNRITTYLSKDNGGMLYAVGQGALAIEVRQGDERIKNLIAKIHCDRTARATLVERSLMRTLEGGCSVPIGVETEWVPGKKFAAPSSGVGAKPAAEYEQLSGVAKTAPENDQSITSAAEDEFTDELLLRAVVLSLDGSEVAEIETRRKITSVKEADEFGFDAARLLVEKGADKILKEVQLNRGIIQAQNNA